MEEWQGQRERLREGERGRRRRRGTKTKSWSLRNEIDEVDHRMSKGDQKGDRNRFIPMLAVLPWATQPFLIENPKKVETFSP